MQCWARLLWMPMPAMPAIADACAGTGALPPLCAGQDLLLLIDIPAVLERASLYIYQRKNLLAEKAGKVKPFFENQNTALTPFINGGYYKITIDVNTVWDSVYRYTAQKARFIAHAEMQAQKTLPAGAGTERGIDLWAFSGQEKDKGLFEQFLREAAGLLGIEYNASAMTLLIHKYGIITGGMLASLRDALNTAAAQYVLYRWYELAGLEAEVKLRQAANITPTLSAQGGI